MAIVAIMLGTFMIKGHLWPNQGPSLPPSYLATWNQPSCTYSVSCLSYDQQSGLHFRWYLRKITGGKQKIGVHHPMCGISGWGWEVPAQWGWHFSMYNDRYGGTQRECPCVCLMNETIHKRAHKSFFVTWRQVLTEAPSATACHGRDQL